MYYLTGQIEILRGHILEGYKLLTQALTYLRPGQDDKRIDYINSFIMVHQETIENAIKIEQLVESNAVLSEGQFSQAILDLMEIEELDHSYATLLRLKLKSLIIIDPFEHLELVNHEFENNQYDFNL